MPCVAEGHAVDIASVTHRPQVVQDANVSVILSSLPTVTLTPVRSCSLSLISISSYLCYTSASNTRRPSSVARCPVNPSTPIPHDDVLCRWVLMKFATNIQHVSEHCWKGCQDHRSKVKVMIRGPIFKKSYVNS